MKRASARASHANGARRRSGARESVWGSPRGLSPLGKDVYQRLRDKYTAAPLSEKSIIRPVAINDTSRAELIGTPSRPK